MSSAHGLETVRQGLLEGRGGRVAVVGAGLSGRAAARLLVERGAHVHLLDDRQSALREAPEGARVGLLEEGPLDAADLVVISPGVPRTQPKLRKSLEAGKVVGEVELASWFITLPMVGITGTNGKSTSTTLLGDILRAGGRHPFVGGNIGKPLSLLPLLNDNFDLAVVELSSYQLESVQTARFRAGVWLNLAADHLDRYPSMEAYGAAKARLFQRVEVEGWVVASASDTVVRAAAKSLHRSVRWFSASAPLDDPMGGVWVSEATARRGEETYALDGPGLLGVHNHENAAASIEVARCLGVSPRAVQVALSGFEGLPHRLALVHEADGVRWYDDSKATNVASAATAVRAMAVPTVLIAGGQDKGGAWGPLVESARHRVKWVLAIGESGGLVRSTFEAHGIPVEVAGTLRAAVARARSLAGPGEAVLLAPACASFDQFDDYRHRGEVFLQLARSGKCP